MSTWQERRDEAADYFVDEGWGLGKEIDEQHCLESFQGGWNACREDESVKKLVEALKRECCCTGELDSDLKEIKCDACEAIADWKGEP